MRTQRITTHPAITNQHDYCIHREHMDLTRSVDWDGWFGTYDNPPQGDRGYVAKRSIFPNKITGVKGYINRVMWMIRNPLYGYNKAVGVKWNGGKVVVKGNPNISDKYKISGWMLTKYYDKNNKLKAFEFYAVIPYSSSRSSRSSAIGFRARFRDL